MCQIQNGLLYRRARALSFLFVVVELVALGSGSSVVSVKNGRVMVDVCLSDYLPCCRDVKGVGIGHCVKAYARCTTVRICCRFSDISLLEDVISGKR